MADTNEPRKWTPYRRDLPKRRPTSQQRLLNLVPSSGIIGMRTLRRHYHGRDFTQILAQVVKLGLVEIQQSGFVADNLHHGKLVVRVNPQIPLTNCAEVHPSP
jgi:hypothetical protein